MYKAGIRSQTSGMSVKTPDISLDKIIDYCRALETAMLNIIMINKKKK